jgi:hypothetical protein
LFTVEAGMPVTGLVVGGLGVLVALATLIGVSLDRQARDGAWTRIAAARRVNAEVKRDLELRRLSLSIREEKLAARERWLDAREEQLRREEKG